MKIDLKIPKGTKCKNGVCEQDIELEGLEIPEEKPSIAIQPQPQFSFQNTSAAGNPVFQQIQIPKEEHKHDHKDPHEELGESMPLGMNFGTCENGNCGNPIIKNPKGITKKFKSCPNCSDNTIRKDAKICKTCGHKKELDEDWNDEGVTIEDEDDE